MKDAGSDDHLLGAVPLAERRGGFTMGLLWITMVTCFPNVLAGFQWYGSGMNLNQVLSGVVVSCLIVLGYSIPACYMGAKHGLTYTVLCRSVFGSWGANLISANVIWISIGWYALNAIFLADGIRGLFDLNVPQVWFAAIMAVLMAVNNFFGFSGVANFARFLAAPILLIWVGFAFFKAAGACPATVWMEAPSIEASRSLTIISSFVIGIACWGNEPDYWRFGKARLSAPVIPLVVSLAIGQVIFPVTGWMMARMTGVTDFAAATRLMNEYVFGGMGIIAACVLAINYVAVNDAGLYAAINAAENLKKLPRKLCVSSLALLAAAASVMLFGYKQNFETVAALSCIILPGATVIMMAEAFLIKPIFGMAEDLSVLMEQDKLPPFRFAALFSLACGCVAAVINSGFLPFLVDKATGVPSVFGWAVSVLVYLIARPIELKFSDLPVCTKSPEPILPSKHRETAGRL